MISVFFQSDIYAVAIVLLELMLPFKINVLLLRGILSEFREVETYCSLLKRLIAFSPENRPDIWQLTKEINSIENDERNSEIRILKAQLNHKNMEVQTLREVILREKRNSEKIVPECVKRSWP